MIKITSPRSGELISLLSDIQQEFLAADRTNAQVEELDWMHLEEKTNKDETYPRKILFTWEPEKAGTLEISADKDFAETYTFAGEGSCEVQNLHGNTKYYARVTCGAESHILPLLGWC